MFSYVEISNMLFKLFKNHCMLLKYTKTGVIAPPQKIVPVCHVGFQSRDTGGGSYDNGIYGSTTC